MALLVVLSAHAGAAPGDEPVIDAPRLTPATGVALYEQNLSLAWSVNSSANETVTTQFHWDVHSHAGAGFDSKDYAFSTPLQTGTTNVPFTAEVQAPSVTGPLYGVVRATVNGTDYYTAEETVIQVLEPPTLETVSYPESVSVGEAIPIVWRIHFDGDPSLIPHTAIHWGLTSKADLPISFTSYPGVGGPFRGTATNEFNASIPALDTPGHVYFIVHAVVNGVNFYREEVSVEVTVPDDAGARGFLPGLDAATAVVALAVAVGVFSAPARRRRS